MPRIVLVHLFVGSIDAIQAAALVESLDSLWGMLHLERNASVKAYMDTCMLSHNNMASMYMDVYTVYTCTRDFVYT